MSILEAKSLVKRFKAFTAVDGVSFSLGEGEILGLLGPNGAGKTTTIQMLLGILSPSSGEVTYFGKNLSDHRAAIMEQINFSSTYTNLPWDLTVLENLTFVSYLYTLPNRRERVQKVIEHFRLADVLTQPIKQLSAGQLTRVNLAKSFINEPKILLLDEPTASLDPEVAAYIRTFLLAERERTGLSMIFTSHNMPEVEEVCDRVIFIDQGKIVADDTPTNLARSIKNTRLELLIDPDTEGAEKLAEERGFFFDAARKRITITIPETEISSFLQELSNKGIVYSEINIDKPTLEDYFLQVSQKQVTEKI